MDNKYAKLISKLDTATRVNAEELEILVTLICKSGEPLINLLLMADSTLERWIKTDIELDIKARLEQDTALSDLIKTAMKDLNKLFD